MFWAKSREIVEGGEAGKELERLRSERRKAGRGGRRGGRKGVEEAVQTNPRGGAAGGRPPRQSLRAQVTAHAQVREAPPSTSGAWGRGGAWLVRGGALRKTRRLVRAARVGGAEGAEARRGDVRSSWSRGLPPAADVRTVNNPERSVEGGGIPGRSRRSAPLQPQALPELGTVGWARARVSEQAGGRDLAGCAVLLRLPDGGARTGRVARSLGQKPPR